MRRIDARTILASLGAIVLLVSLFLHWYAPGISAWQAFEVLDLLLAALALGMLWLTASPLVLGEPRRESAMLWVGIASLLIVTSQLVNHPPAAAPGHARLGAWLALAGAAAMAAPSLPWFGRLDLGERRSLRRLTPSDEAAEVEPEIYEELYPEHERQGPIGADDPDLWQAASERSEEGS
jgi:peptidoglycan/LPS O-acetylase OafA/YrhL